jgi:hypothetical protein
VSSVWFSRRCDDSRMSPDLPIGTGKSIGGDLDVDDEGSEQCWFQPYNHYTTAPLVTNPYTQKLVSPRSLCPCKQIENTSKNRKEQSRIADE